MMSVETPILKIPQPEANPVSRLPIAKARNIETIPTELKEELQHAIHQEEPEKKSEAFWMNDEFRKKYIGRYSLPAYGLSSVFHVLTAGVLGLTNFSPKAKANLATVATGFTKLINSIIYGDLALGALKSRNTFDFISRILEPILNMFSQLSNYHLLRGLSSAMTQLHLVNFPHITQKDNLWANFIENIQLTKKFFVEAWTSSLFGPNRKLFKGGKDEGHTLALTSHIQAVSSMIGLLNGSRRNLIDQIVGTVRNFIGVAVDIELFFRKDPDERKAGIFYFAHALLDTLKRFIPKDKADCLDNMIMPVYNAAMYHFGQITRKQSEKKDVEPIKEVERVHQPSLEKAMAA